MYPDNNQSRILLASKLNEGITGTEYGPHSVYTIPGIEKLTDDDENITGELSFEKNCGNTMEVKILDPPFISETKINTRQINKYLFSLTIF